MKELVTLKSGAKLELGQPDLEDAVVLLEATAAELKQVGIDLGDLRKLSLQGELTLASLDSEKINTFKNVVCQLVGSPSLKKIILRCAARSLHNGQAVTFKTFEDAREDYLPTLQEVMVFSLRPFFKGLDFGFLTAPAAPAQNPG